MSEKVYYSIGEVAEMFNVNTSLIRYWEKEFKILKPKKNRKGNRLFTVEDIENLKNIYSLVKEKGYTLQGAKDALSNNNIQAQPQEFNQERVVTTLKSLKQFLLEVKNEL
ncbi:MAG: MerR family transcriptional regulator [Hyphomicrobiales bacterium]